MGLNAETGKRVGDLAVALYGSKTKFAEAMGITPQNLNHWICRGVKNSVLELILFKHPNINRNWLYSGEGDMFGHIQADNSDTAEMPRRRQIGERIKYAAEHLEQSIKGFADKLGESLDKLNEWINNGANKRDLELILTAYPMINSDWLINGNGLPFLDNPQSVQAKAVKMPDGSYSPYCQVTSGASSIVGATHGANVGSIIQSVTPKVTREEKASSTVINEAVNSTVQVLTSVIERLSSQLSDKDKIIMRQMDAIASLDERIREIEKLINNKPTA